MNLNQSKRMKPADPPFTIASVILIVIAVGVMLYIYLRHRVSSPGWANYALMMIGFALIGFIGTMILSQSPMKFAQFNVNTGIRAVILLILCLITQIITQTALSISTVDRALYYVFGAVCEEVFFRVFLLNIFAKISLEGKKQAWIIIAGGIVVQAGIFAALHGNYYGNLAMIVAVFIGGLILGIGYVLWTDATANILAHFLLNLIAVQSLLIVL